MATKGVTGGPINYQTGTIALSTSTMSGGLTIDGAGYYQPDISNVTVTNGMTYSPYNLSASVIKQSVRGTLVEYGSNTPLVNIGINPCASCVNPFTTWCPVYTGADGSFGPVNTCVLDRTPQYGYREAHCGRRCGRQQYRQRLQRESP
jgi:hypothetical protein